MTYREFIPSTELEPFVKCYWTLEDKSGRNHGKQRIVPDGCMEMIFHYGDLFKQYLDEEKFIIQPRSFVFGQITRPLEIEPSGQTGVFSVRFHPGGFLPFTSLDISELADRAVSLKYIFGREGRTLESGVLQASSAADRIRTCASFLLNKLTDHENIDQVIRQCVAVLLQNRGSLGIGDLSGKMNIQRRQLERRFARIIGLSPKQLARVIRLKSTLNLMLKGEYYNLTALAHDCNYFDQAHFIKEFKEFTGQTPKNFYADNLKMSALFHQSEL